jgi:hypothetical protein
MNPPIDYRTGIIALSNGIVITILPCGNIDANSFWGRLVRNWPDGVWRIYGAEIAQTESGQLGWSRIVQTPSG